MPRIVTRISDVKLLSAVSGTYVTPSRRTSGLAVSATLDTQIVRLDVDGYFPQMMASGSHYRLAVTQAPAHWVARLTRVDASTWQGQILTVWGDASLMPHKFVRIHVPGVAVLSPEMTITYDPDGPAPVTRTLRFDSPYFRAVTVEFDAVADAPQVTWVPTCAHSERPGDLRCENLTFEKVFDRAGVEITQSSRRSVVPLSHAGGNEAWEDAELHAAMRTFWSAYAEAPQWAIWVLFAGVGRSPTLMGTMFDDSDRNQRQGVAIFNNGFEDEKNIPASYPQRPEHIRRERFFGLVHETGHCFNLHHAWWSYNPQLRWPFFDTAEGSATFMNYPNKVFGFYSKFRYEFHDSDIKFMRHAPPHFVEMGNERFWPGADEFGREVDYAAGLELSVELPRSRGVFEFLEPITLGIALRNTSRRPQVVDERMLDDAGHLTVLVGCGCGGHQQVRRVRPFAQYCYWPTPRVLEPGESLRTTCFVSAGVDGWYLSEPGAYTLQAVLATDAGVVASSRTRLRIAPSRTMDEEQVAQELFTTDVGRAFAFGTSHGLGKPVDTLREVLERLPQRAVARHAALALAEPWKEERRVLKTGGDVRGFDRIAPRPEEARELMTRALLDRPDQAERCFGQRRYEELRQQYAAWLARKGGRGSK
jgi:hypothetical protein